jgi:hypothetical protein
MNMPDPDLIPVPSSAALLHHPQMSEASVKTLLASINPNWQVFVIDGEEGVWILPEYGVPVDEFSTTLLALGADDWVLTRDPRQ